MEILLPDITASDAIKQLEQLTASWWAEEERFVEKIKSLIFTLEDKLKDKTLNLSPRQMRALQDYVLDLKFQVFATWIEDDQLELIKNHFAFAVRDELLGRLDLATNVRAFIDEHELWERNDVMKKLRTLLETSDELVLDLPSEVQKSPVPKLREVVAAYKNYLGVGNFSKTSIAGFIFRGQLTSKLSKNEQRVLLRVFEYYEVLKVDIQEFMSLGTPSFVASNVNVPFEQYKAIAFRSPLMGYPWAYKEMRDRYVVLFDRFHFNEIPDRLGKIEENGLEQSSPVRRQKPQPVAPTPPPAPLPPPPPAALPPSPRPVAPLRPLVRPPVSQTQVPPKRPSGFDIGRPLPPKAKEVPSAPKPPVVPTRHRAPERISFAHRPDLIAQQQGSVVSPKPAKPMVNHLASLEEVKKLSVSDFRRFGKVASESVTAVMHRFDELGAASPVARVQVKEMWKQSDLYALYKDMGKESIMNNRTVREVSIDRQRKGAPYLSEREFEAVAEISSKL